LRVLNERHAILPLEPVGGAAIAADITVCAGQSLSILSASFSGVQHGTAGGSTQDDDLYLAITVAGRSVARQGRTVMTLMPGDGVLLSARDGFTMTHAEPVQFVGLRVSRARLVNQVNSADAAVMHPMRRSTALAWLTKYFDTMLTEPALAEVTRPAADVRRHIVSHVYDMIGAAIASTREFTPTRDGLGIRAARLRAIESHILSNLGSQLSVTAVAAHHRITPRYVHKLFEGSGTSYSAFVLVQRLARVYRMLADVRFADRSISALAYDVGFGDLSYFNREFKRRYNATPSDVRRGAFEAQR
jgi:AraC-like DNA-binding protein